VPARLRRIELITGAERRRKWSAEEKSEIVAESLAEGAVVSEVARRHGLNPQQLFGWRARLRAAVKSSAPSSAATPAFVPAIVEDEPPSSAAPALPAAVMAMGAAGVTPASIEIALGGVIVRVRGEADAPRAEARSVLAVRHQAAAGTQLPCRPKGTRLASFTIATGPRSTSVASRTARSLRFSAARHTVASSHPSPSGAFAARGTNTGSDVASPRGSW